MGRIFRSEDRKTPEATSASGATTVRNCRSALSGRSLYSARVLYGILLGALCLAGLLQGCGSGGYAGAGIASLSAATVTIDAGQSIDISANVTGTVPVGWTIASSACTGAACGSLSSTSGKTITFTAPSPVATPYSLTLTATVTGTKSTKTVTVNVNPAPAISGNPPAGTVGITYSTTLVTTGGTAPLHLSLTAGALPAGLSFNAATGVISGTPTAAGTANFTVQLVDSSDVPFTVTANKQIVISNAGTVAPLTVVGGNPPTGVVGTAYTTALQASGGVAPYTWSVTGGALPGGLTLSASTGVISGTPTAAGSFPFTAQAKDAAGTVASGSFTIVVLPVIPTAPTITSGSLPNGTVNVPYSSVITATGGTGPYTCSLAAGTLPAGLTLAANCTVSGTPTVAGTSTPTIKVTDSGSPAQSVTGPVTITISPAPSLALTTATLPDGTVGTPYSSTIGVTGGIAPYTCTLAAGALPNGLSLAANCAVTGTPTVAGTFTPSVKATDSSNPALTVTAPVSVVIHPAPLALTNGALPDGTVGTPYSSTIGVTGGTGPYTCALSAGTLPAGLALAANCTVSGTPTVAGTSTPTIKVTDSGNPALTVTGPEKITIAPAPLALAAGSLPDGTVGTPYSSTVGVTGGTGPYTCTLAGGVLPTGLTLAANCAVTGTPTVAGTSTPLIKVTDSGNPALTITAPEKITINAAASLVVSSPPAATAGSPYTGTVGVSGGTAPYQCSITAGTLPAGLTLGANCTITGTPSAPGSTPVTVQATDSGTPTLTGTGPVTVTVNPAPVTLVLANPPTATVNTPYTGTIPVNGGSGPYSCTLAGGTLPAGLTLGAGCTITGTPTTAGTTTAQVTATDSSSPAKSNTGGVTVTVQGIPPLTLAGSLPVATLNQPYTQTLQAAGGVGPYTYAVTAGTLPAGITLSSTGIVSGTPTVVGANSFTVTATDSEGTPQTASLPLILQVVYPATPQDALLAGPYAFLFQGYDDVVAGVLAYQTATVGSLTADGKGVVSTGEQDSNHQSSNPTGNTIATHALLGTYTIGSDRRGTLALTTLNADGTTGTTVLYSIAMQAPVGTATSASGGSLTETDNDHLTGTKGSGTLFAQTASAFATGLSGSYAFGMSGDTPCLPACTVGIVAGPVATVGQISASGGSITGTADANIASTHTANSGLSGSYDAADANGRVQVTLGSVGLAGVPYPTDYAVYVVDANRLLLMSTDKHSAYILQAGTAQLQTQAVFSNASLGSAYVGYENSPVNPGLLGTTLQSVLNLSTATVFRGTGNGAGTCDTTNVDSSGTTGVVNGLGGLVSAPLVNALLGSYQALGTSSCTVAANGRATLAYPAPSPLLQLTLTGLGLPTTPAPRVVYLVSPNQGYFLETGYAGLGMLQAQTGGSFTNANFNGSFVYGTIPASTLATVDSSGVLNADGAGNITSTLDRNVGVGTVNLINLGVTGTATYNITDGVAGRYQLSTNEVVYAIAPGRFVLLEPEVLNTSAYVALLF